MIEIREAKLDDVPAITGLYKEVWDGKYPYSDFLKESEIERILREGENIWMLALDGNRIVGSAACMHNRWNNSTEFGRGVVSKDYWNKHVGMTLSEQLVKKAFEAGFDICWGTPRNKPVCNVVTNLGFGIMGYMPGPYIIDFREIYLFAMRLSDSCRSKRITPYDKGELYDLQFVKEVNRKFSLEDNPGKYPEDSFVGDEIISTNTIKLKHIPEHKALFVLSSNITKRDVCYIEGDILTDKKEMISLLKSLDFKITAYLPAWYGTDKRFDCIKMARYFESCSSYDDFVKQQKDRIEAELNG